jgi:hypothetical protein
MAYTTFQRDERYGPRKGLEGPFTYGNGRILYYDPVEGQYWDPRTDIYLDNDELMDLQGLLVAKLRGAK